MSKSLYPTALFHFTKEKNVFESIIKGMEFRVSYAREFIKGASTNRNFGIPMVSFCDIRLSQLEQHTKSYGEFGIGLSKEWAENNNLNPVIYMNKESDVFDRFNTQLRKIKNKIKKDYDSDDEILSNEVYRNLINVMRYMKNYSGTLKRVGKKDVSNYIFADEREWRYIPKPGEMNGSAFIVSGSNIDTKEKKAKYNNGLKNVVLNFGFDDVKYFIVDKEDSIDSLIDLFIKMDVEKKHYSKIICSKQINDDL
ncbi:abortive infection system antitoxin AbiGi family protein [Pectobacterium polaris]|uniref:abortive infection system antitoxin AbiGi family protein n=1 Tax=Pectobacterium polaris TaxID=2042057 RepID=UPI000F8D7C31|nr:abortive infection system antitoxin AbiGi family protein [Pectobacterium polaris]RUR99424.1 hypothetical protein KHDHEBDM_01707 [Pectobacterium polaris]